MYTCSYTKCQSRDKVQFHSRQSIWTSCPRPLRMFTRTTRWSMELMSIICLPLIISTRIIKHASIGNIHLTNVSACALFYTVIIGNIYKSLFWWVHQRTITVRTGDWCQHFTECHKQLRTLWEWWLLFVWRRLITMTFSHTHVCDLRSTLSIWCNFHLLWLPPLCMHKWVNPFHCW